MRGLPATPPELPPFRPGAFPSRVRSEWLSARLGLLLGSAVTVCFTTGLVSHLHQHPVSWLPLPADPVWAYQVSQGLHVTTGLAAIPLLAVKLWAVYPKLFAWPPASSLTALAERASIAVLAAGTGFELLTGVFNLAHLYLWPFFFPTAHYAVAWLVAGSVLLHVAVRWPAIVRGLSRRASAAVAAGTEGAGSEAAGFEAAGTEAAAAAASKPTIGTEDVTPQDDEAGPSRRGVLVAAVGGAAAVVVTTVGQTFPPLRWAGLLAPRSPGAGGQRVPVNRTAGGAGVVRAAQDPAYRLVVTGPRGRSFSLADLARLPQVQAELPIACVEGWSASARWSGPRLRDVLDACGVPADATVEVTSLERHGLYASAQVPPEFARHPLTLLATGLDGAPLSLDHGYPVRLIAPNRPGVLQTKWVGSVSVQ